MRALTICQPYAELIRRGVKRVENRRWETAYRGPLLIHAGKSLAWLDLSEDGQRDESYDLEIESLAFGAIVAVADLVAVQHVGVFRGQFCPSEYAWVASHEHASGPYCWILQNVRSLDAPLPCVGKQGLWVPGLQIVERLASLGVAV